MCIRDRLGAGNKKPEILSKLAQYELTLKDWVQEHKGYRKYVAIAGKCWPAFQTQFGFVPCYVNSRLTAQGIPVSCEVDIYGCLLYTSNRSHRSRSRGCVCILYHVCRCVE